MSKYSKKIEAMPSGMVTAEVFYLDDTLVALRFFTSIFDTESALERKFNKAHKWADERIKIIEREEVRQ